MINFCEYKREVSVLEQEIGIANFKILHCDRNRHGGGLPRYIRNYLCYNILSLFSCETEKKFQHQ